MTNPFRDTIKEPSWMTYGPDDPDEPPENYLPDEARKALAELGNEWLDPVDIKDLMHSVLTRANQTQQITLVEEVYEQWLVLTKAFRGAVLDLHDETVGDDWWDQ